MRPGNTVRRVQRARASCRPRLREVAMKALHKRCAGLDVHKAEVVACLRVVTNREVGPEVRRFPTTTQGLLALTEWLGVREARMWRWKRPACTGSRSGTFSKDI